MLLVLLVNGKNTRMPLSPYQDLARGRACSGTLTLDLPEECRFLPNTQLMFLKKEKDPTSKLFDDDEWIRSLTEAPEVTTVVPEDSVTNDQQDVDPQKGSAHSDGRVLAEIRLAATTGTQ